MTDKNGVGVTIISHDSEKKMLVNKCKLSGCYSRTIRYNGARLSQVNHLTRIASHCEQFIKYECLRAKLFKSGRGWWVSRDSNKMTYWGGASPGSGKCACGMTNSCAANERCNCDANDGVWREDSGLLADKTTKLPVKQLRFGDNEKQNEKGYHTLGKLKCYGKA